jgi:hypothetical protein
MSACVDHFPPREVVSVVGEDLSYLAGADMNGPREIAVGHNSAFRDSFDQGTNRVGAVVSGHR